MRLTSILFATSFTLAVATGWVHLEAGPNDDGPAELRAVQELAVAGQRVGVSLDRARVPAGAAVRLTVSAVEPGAAGRELAVRVMAQTGSPMERVPTPPREVARATVRLATAPVTIPLTLPGAPARADRLATAGRITQYTVVVSDGHARDAAVVALPVFAYEPEAFRLAIDPPAPGPAGTPVDVTVRVTSVADAPLRGVVIRAGGSLFTSSDAARVVSLAPGATAVVTLHGVRGEVGAGDASLVAYGNAERGGTASLWTRLDPRTGGLTVLPPPVDLMLGMY
ncbi:MAG: hypothetical protein IPH44_35510 [Myxococcales bacterium]|nr:hypothetical protein [Myxococcales bacterium]MBK7194748.1 hypothetical protein [Myxococcales bacterium]MBP6843680.1 hypothetical protein [Kofleriaceae bacterium]